METATAIIAASIPVLRVFFKEAVSSFSNSHRPSQSHSNSRPVPLSKLNRSHTTALRSVGKGKECGWTTIEDGASQRGVLQDEGGLLRVEEQALGKDGMVIVEHEGILQTNTITVTVEEDSKSQHTGRSWLGAPSECNTTHSNVSTKTSHQL